MEAAVAGDQGCLQVKLIHMWSNLVTNVFMLQLTSLEPQLAAAHVAHSDVNGRGLAGIH